MFRISFKFRITDLSLTGGVLFAIASPTKAIAPPRYEAPSMCRLISLSSTTVDCFLRWLAFPDPLVFSRAHTHVHDPQTLDFAQPFSPTPPRSSRVSNYHALAPHATLYRKERRCDFSSRSS